MSPAAGDSSETANVQTAFVLHSTASLLGRVAKCSLSCPLSLLNEDVDIYDSLTFA